MECRVNNYSQTCPAVVHEKNRRWHARYRGEEIISGAEQKSQAAVGDCEPAVKVIVRYVFEAVPTPENIQADKAG